MRRVFWITAVVLLLLTRVPAYLQYLSIDNVNLAFALERFDPIAHQPQPPGYPFFVGFARVVNLFFGDPEKSFLFISLLVSGLCLPIAKALGTRMGSPVAGYAAAALLLFDPSFWQSGVEGPLRPTLALFSLLTAYCAWRSWNGEARYAVWGGLALGVGSGFRPDLLAYLFPVWAVSAVVGTRSIRVVMQGMAALAVMVAIWVGSLAYAVGGIRALSTLISGYLTEQSSSQSIVLGAVAGMWQRQVSRLLVWNGLAVIGWVWAFPLVWLSSKGRTDLFRLLGFVLIWVFPGLLFQGLVHVGAAGHTVFSIPAWCILGGIVLERAMTWFRSEDVGGAVGVGDSTGVAGSAGVAGSVGVAVVAALVLNILTFLNFFPLPPPDASALRNIWAYGARDASLVAVQWSDNVHRVTMAELKELVPQDRPWIVVSTDDSARKDWFMNWRIFRYHAPSADIWVAADQNRVLRVKRDQVVTMDPKAGLEIPVPRGGRIIWLIEIGGALYRDLLQDRRLEAPSPNVSRERLFYTDVPMDGESFTAWGYTFTPR